MKALLFIVLCYSTFCVQAQKVDTLDNVDIVPHPISLGAMRVEISKKTIENQLISDVGQLMQYIPGIQLKSYGDIGGMKSVSFRSLGAGHTVFVQDFQALSMTQSGQADLSQLPTEFIHQLSFITLSPVEITLPIHAKMSGSVVALSSKHTTQKTDSTHLIAGIQVGSFGSIDGTIFGKYDWKKWRVSLSSKIRSYRGDYPFEYKNGTNVERSRRLNNELLDAYGTLNIEFSPNEQHHLRFQLQGSGYAKELAGAVVFYNPSIKQYLNGSGYSGSLQHRFAKNRWSIFSRLNYQKNQLQYVDSNYLNIQGYLDNRYASSQVDGDFQIKRRIAEKDHIVVGFGAIHETTQSETLPQTPTRITQENLLGYQHDGKLTLNLQLGSQTIIESRKQTPTAISYLLPSLSIGYRFHPKYQIAIAYRYTNRQPTFSELYYQQIGNLELKTEKAQIASIRLQTRLHRSKWSFYGIIEPFYSEITDKILAIPTKNLFIWSILNIGRTRSYGVEVSTQLNYEFTNSTVGIHLNYTYLEALDITDPEGATYRHTLSYSPKNTGTVQLTWTRKQFTVFGQMHGLTSRYILNQNIPENELAGFYTLDAGAGYKLDFNKSALKFNIHIRNITNNYYSYINYFILPGINLQFRLTYVL